MNDITHGEIAYNAYCSAIADLSEEGERPYLVKFELLNKATKLAWQKAAEAAIDYYEDKQADY